MDLGYEEVYEQLRAELRGFLATHWPVRGADAELPKAEQRRIFRRRATEAGYLYRSVPPEYGGAGRQPDAVASQVIREEFVRVGAPLEVGGVGNMLLVPTLLEHGTESQKRQFIPKTLVGEYHWSQGYSEPNAGSDLASLRTRAVLEGGEWRISGQKIWSTLAQHAHFMFLLARTEPGSVDRHARISYLLVDLRQPGVTIRPLRQLTGATEFCEVFFDDARAPADWIVGRRGEGWHVSRSTLRHERSAVGAATNVARLFESLVELAGQVHVDGGPAIENAAIRERLAALECYVKAHLYSSYRQLSMQAHGQDAGVVTLMNKLINTNIAHRVADIARDLVGERLLRVSAGGEEQLRHGGQAAAPGLLRAPPDGARGELPDPWVEQFMASTAMGIFAGTSNIQRNVIAERGYGLPRDAAVRNET